MKSRRRWRLRHRLAILGVALAAMSTSTAGCQCDQDNQPGTDMGDTNNGVDPDMGETNNGVDPDMGGTNNGVDPDMGNTNNMVDPDMGSTNNGNGEITGLREVGTQVSAPFDATPSPDASTVYFVALKGDGVGAALFSVPAAGGAATEVADGFVAPFSLVSSLDGSTIYVADLGADDETTNRAGGVIYRVTVSTGDVTALAETAGYQARGLDLVDAAGTETLYFSGVRPSTGMPGVFEMPTGTGTVSEVATGGLFGDPSGVAVTSGGTVYVADTVLGTSSGILVVTGAETSNFVQDLRVGYPAGIALSADESHLLVSGLDPVANSAVVYRITLADKTVEQVNMGIEQNSESAGVHRAHDADQYAWANADSPGTVYLIGTSASPLN